VNVPDREHYFVNYRLSCYRRAVEAIDDPDRDQEIADFVQERRRARGLTQAALGELAGVGRRFVGDLERGKTSLRMDAINAVLAVFGKTLGVVDRPKAQRP
jgi:y4mF family transcriptional regulator